MPSLLRRQQQLQKRFGEKRETAPKNFSDELKWLREVSHSTEEGKRRKRELFGRHRAHCLAVLSKENPGQDKKVHHWVVWAYDLAEAGEIPFTDFLRHADDAIRTKQVPNGEPVKLPFADWKHFKVEDYLQGIFDREEKIWLKEADWIPGYLENTEFDQMKRKLAGNILYFAYYWLKNMDEKAALDLGARALAYGAPIKTDYNEFQERMANASTAPPDGKDSEPSSDGVPETDSRGR